MTPNERKKILDWMEKAKWAHPDGSMYVTTHDLTAFIESLSMDGEGAHTKEDLRNMLEDVVNELDLSDSAIEKHGPLGTSPSELVRLVIEEKDRQIALLKAGFKSII